MTRREHWILLLATFVVAAVLGGPALLAQVFQSGGAGSTVTANAGTNLNTSALALSATQTDRTQKTQISDGTRDGTVKAASTLAVATDTAVVVAIRDAIAATQSGTWTMQPGNTANTTAWFVKSVPATTCGTTAVSQALVAVPTSSTAVFTATTCLWSVLFENSNAGTQTVTLTDNAGTPLNAVGPAFVIPGLSNMVIPFGGIPFTTGVKWTAGGTGVLGGMSGYQ